MSGLEEKLDGILIRLTSRGVKETRSHVLKFFKALPNIPIDGSKRKMPPAAWREVKRLYRLRHMIFAYDATAPEYGLARFRQLAKESGAVRLTESRWDNAFQAISVMTMIVVPFVLGMKFLRFNLAQTAVALLFSGAVVILILAALKPTALGRTVGDLFANLALFSIGAATLLLVMVFIFPRKPPDPPDFPWRDMAIIGVSPYITMVVLLPLGYFLMAVNHRNMCRKFPEAMIFERTLTALSILDEGKHPGTEGRRELAAAMGEISVLIRRYLPFALYSSNAVVRDAVRSRCEQASQAVREYEYEAVFASAMTRDVLAERLRALGNTIVYSTYDDLPHPKEKVHFTTKRLIMRVGHALRLLIGAAIMPAAVLLMDRLFRTTWWDGSAEWWEDYRGFALLFAVVWVLAMVSVMLFPQYRDPLQFAKEIIGILKSGQKSDSPEGDGSRSASSDR